MPFTYTSRLRVLAAAIVALALLALPAVASAKKAHGNDRNHDGIADKWAKKYSLGKGKGVAKKDPDSDGLSNLAEFRANTNPRKEDSDGDGTLDANEDGDNDHVDNGNEVREHTNPGKADSNRNGTKDGAEDADRDHLNNAGEDELGTDPINPDSDGDGVDDGDEGAGTITSFDGTTLTVHVFGGADLVGTVDEATSISCDSGDLWGDDQSGDGGASKSVVAADDSSDSTDDFSDDDPDATDDPANNDDSTDDGGDLGGDGSDCTAADLTPGAVVRAASVSVDTDGTFFDEVELIK
ncbi:MAG: hypothetical protein QOG63_2747 [Thermoleophilaceae bacterium]|nr:hypothetical protein [Thermoleophilaceae bacterium]